MAYDDTFNDRGLLFRRISQIFGTNEVPGGSVIRVDFEAADSLKKLRKEFRSFDIEKQFVSRDWQRTE